MRINSAVALSLSAFSTVAFAQSETPSPHSTNAVEGPRTSATQSDKNATRDQRETEQMPLVVKVLPSVSVEKPVAGESKKEHDYNSSEWWLVYLTGTLATFTLGLMIYTAKLWGATVKLSRDADASAQRQADEMRRSLATAEKAATAAERGAEIAERSLTVAQRAFVFGKGFTSAVHFIDEKLAEYVFWTELENAGHTPATRVQSWINTRGIPGETPQEPTFQKDIEVEASTVLGPRATAQSGYVSVPLATMIDSWNKKTAVFIWSRVEYRDIFDPDKVRHHEQCARIEVIHEPSTVPPQGHPPYVQFTSYGLQNSTA